MSRFLLKMYSLWILLFCVNRGELVSFQGCDMKPTESGNQASKSFERIVAFLKTDSKGIALLEVNLFVIYSIFYHS